MTNAYKFIKDPKLKKVLKENAGIGRPATRAEILKTLEARNYIERKDKLIIITQRGITLIEALKDEPVVDVAMTAVWEQSLDNIAQGKESASDFMQGITDYTIDFVARVKSAKIKINVQGAANVSTNGNGNNNNQEVLGKCKECGGDVVESAKAFGCSNWKNGCKFTIWKTSLERFGKKEVSLALAKKALTGEVFELKGLTSKGGKKYDAKGQLTKHEQFGWQIQLIFPQRNSDKAA